MRRFEPVLDAEGNVAEWRKKGMYFFVHNKELRDSYDTFKVIQRLAKIGFKEEQGNTEVINKTYLISPKK